MINHPKILPRWLQQRFTSILKHRLLDILLKYHMNGQPPATSSCVKEANARASVYSYSFLF